MLNLTYKILIISFNLKLDSSLALLIIFDWCGSTNFNWKNSIPNIFLGWIYYI